MSNNLFKRTGSDDFPSHLKVLVSGPPKSGKTSLLGTVPNLIVLDTEPHANNLQSIAHLDVPYVTITNTDDLRQVLMMLSDPHLRKTVADAYGLPEIGGVAIDTLDSLQKIMKQERMREQRTNQFLRDDWGWLKGEMEKLVEAFTKLPMHVFFMVHTKSKEMGKGDDAYTINLPGLEGAIAESIAGMVGYSLMSFRKEEVQPDGTLDTKYFLRTEGNATNDFLGTRVAGVKLPTVIEPNMATIYNAVLAARPKQQAAAVAQPPAPAPTQSLPPQGPPPEQWQQAPQQPPAQHAPQGEQQPTPAQQGGQPLQQQQEAPKPADDEPLNAAALGHLKRVYDAVGLALPEDALKEHMSIGDARKTVQFWRGLQEDEANGKMPDGNTAVSEMVTYLQGLNLGGATTEEKAPVEEKVVEPKIDGTIEEVMAYVGDDMAKAQEAFNLEMQKEDAARKGLITKLEAVGARPQAQLPSTPPPSEETPAEVPTDVETSAPAESAPEVTPEPAPADAPSQEQQRDEQALQAVTEGLGATVVAEEINMNAKCEKCGGDLDDPDLAELGQKRYGKLLCVKDYLAEQKSK